MSLLLSVSVRYQRILNVTPVTSACVGAFRTFGVGVGQEFTSRKLLARNYHSTQTPGPSSSVCGVPSNADTNEGGTTRPAGMREAPPTTRVTAGGLPERNGRRAAICTVL